MTGPLAVEITLDAVDAERVAEFWCAALGYERLYERGSYVVCGSPGDPSAFRVNVQRVAERTTVKARLHLDLRVADPPAEVRRLVELGATVVAEMDEGPGHRWTVMADPEGAELCICQPRRPN